MRKIILTRGSGQSMTIAMALAAKSILAEQYEVPVSSIVWMGKSKFIVVKDGKEIQVDLEETE